MVCPLDQPFPRRVLEPGDLLVGPGTGFRKDFEVGRIDDDVQVPGFR